MFLRSTRRWKDGKEHHYWSLVENRRCGRGGGGGRVVQQTVLYLGEINASQKEQWIRAIEVFDEERGAAGQLKLFAAERGLPPAAPDGVQVRLREFELHRPRQWGGCWLFTELWKELGLDGFWRERLGLSREGTDWEHVLETLSCYRLLDPGSEWRLHRASVRALGDGRSPGGGFFHRGQGHALPLSGPAARTQARALRSLEREMARPLPRSNSRSCSTI